MFYYKIQWVIHSANVFLKWKRVLFFKILVKYDGWSFPSEIAAPKHFVNVLLIYTLYAHFKIHKKENGKRLYILILVVLRWGIVVLNGVP